MTTVAKDHLPVSFFDRIGKRARAAFVILLGFSIMTIGSLLTLTIAVLTLFQARRFYTDFLIAPMARLAIWSVGIRFVVHQDQPLTETQTVYIANHGSTIDIFVLTAMRLPNARFFLSGYLRKRLPPIGLFGYLAGVFWTVPQEFPQRRIKIFQRAEQVLKNTGESVFLSPEGNTGRMGVIAPFNKGAFHLATNLSAPIVPIYIAIPRDIDPGWSYNFRPGVVHVYIQSPVATDDWDLKDLDENREKMRDYFVELQTRYQGQQ